MRLASASAYFGAYLGLCAACLAAMFLAWAVQESRLRRISKAGQGPLRARWSRPYLASFALCLPLLAFMAYFFFPTRVARRSDLEEERKGALVIVNLDANWYMAEKQAVSEAARQAIRDALELVMLRPDGKEAPGDYRVRWFMAGASGVIRDFQLIGSGPTRLQASECARCYFAKRGSVKQDLEAFTSDMYQTLVSGGWNDAATFLSVLKQIEEAKSFATGQEQKPIQADLFQVTLSMDTNISTGLTGGARPAKHASRVSADGTGYYYSTWILLDRDGRLDREARAELEDFRKRIDSAEHPLQLSAFDLSYDIDESEKAVMAALLLTAGLAALLGAAWLDGVKMRTY
jgi:hypothetical protein